MSALVAVAMLFPDGIVTRVVASLLRIDGIPIRLRWWFLVAFAASTKFSSKIFSLPIFATQSLRKAFCDLRNASMHDDESRGESLVAIKKCLSRSRFFKVDTRLLELLARRASSLLNFTHASH